MSAKGRQPKTAQTGAEDAPTVDLRHGRKDRTRRERRMCERCGAPFMGLVRKTKPGRFCSKSCATTQAMLSPERRLLAAEVNRGPNHHGWQGGGVSEEGGRKRARRMYARGPCEKCNAPNGERHHVDGDTVNNTRENIAILCRRCHMEADGRLEASRLQAKAMQSLGAEARRRQCSPI